MTRKKTINWLWIHWFDYILKIYCKNFWIFNSIIIIMKAFFALVFIGFLAYGKWSIKLLIKIKNFFISKKISVDCQEFCSNEGGTCAGIANLQCCQGLVCIGVGNYPDASGVCRSLVPCKRVGKLCVDSLGFKCCPGSKCFKFGNIFSIVKCRFNTTLT